MLATARLINRALAAGITPDADVDPVQWAARHLVVADGPKAGTRWDDALTPYMREILRLLSTSNPETLITVRKSGQLGMTEGGIVWLGYIIDVAPARAMVIFPTTNAVQDFNRDKLQPTIMASSALRRKVREQRSRSGEGSTSLNKKFPGGSLVLTGANSAADLRSKTVKYLFCDEIDEWPQDLDGQGDPMEMADARQIAFHASAEYKKFQCSTPTIRGISRIDAAFEAGDQRFFRVPCPECDEYQRLVFKNLKFSTKHPHNAQYACAHCGVLIEHHHKRAMVQAGKWVAERPEPGRHPSFHIDSLTSLLTTWDNIAEKFLSSKDEPRKLKAFVNLWLGEAWEERGDAPEWQRLYARREDYGYRSVPRGGLIVTAAADVQKDGIFYEVVAWGVGKTSWSIDSGFLPGDTADKNGEAWRALDEVRGRKYPDCYGNALGIDVFGVDSGFNSEAVYSWVRRWPATYALKGQPGWYHLEIGTPAKLEVNARGQKKRRGLQVWPVGTWPLKSELYANLRKQGRRDGQEFDPPGYCHFGDWLDERYFQQVVAEYIREREHRGRVVKEWVASGDNHYHDCRIYNMALTEHPNHFLLSRWGEDEWMKLAAARCVPPANIQGDLFEPTGKAAPPPAAKQTTEKQPEERRSKDWLPDRNNWLG